MEICPSIVLSTVMIANAPIDPVNDINLPYLAANNPAMKNVLSPISLINMSRKIEESPRRCH
uniref:Uncharacterized protein n=1 Tax=uncultured organism MedDCM-OCT-S08-C998 TaxID=743643 RepID=D6PJB5_9ZZZZ|nr:hypothetical protein [uncultured organism MedDCM-OCT-S08-C998]